MREKDILETLDLIIESCYKMKNLIKTNQVEKEMLAKKLNEEAAVFFKKEPNQYGWKTSVGTG